VRRTAPESGCSGSGPRHVRLGRCSRCTSSMSVPTPICMRKAGRGRHIVFGTQDKPLLVVPAPGMRLQCVPQDAAVPKAATTCTGKEDKAWEGSNDSGVLTGSGLPSDMRSHLPATRVEPGRWRAPGTSTCAASRRHGPSRQANVVRSRAYGSMPPALPETVGLEPVMTTSSSWLVSGHSRTCGRGMRHKDEIGWWSGDVRLVFR